jgi:hypothetical protein
VFRNHLDILIYFFDSGEALHARRVAGEWPRERFKKCGIEYFSADKPKSDLYLAALPAIMSGKVDLLDNSHLITQLCGLERSTGRGGRDSVDHRPDTPTVWPIFIEKKSRHGDFGSVGYADAPHLAPLAERQKWPVW